MSGFRKLEIIESSFFTPKSFPFSFPIDEHDLDFTLDFFNPIPSILDFHNLALIEPPLYTKSQLLKSQRATQFYLNSLCDRVSALEETLLVKPKLPAKADRKYTWTTEISSPEKDGLDRTYKLAAEIKGGKKEEKSYKWTAVIKGKGENSALRRKYTFEASTDNTDAAGDSKKKIKEKSKAVVKKNKKPEVAPARVVEIQDSTDQGALVLRHAFAKRAAAKSKGKRKELSFQDAAMLIQMTFRAYLIRRSQVLRALRELAVAKAKLKELRVLFNNFTYRRQVSRDAEERQKFSERIIVLLLTVDAIEGADVMVRAAKRSMVDELEAMLDVIDPQPAGRSLSMRRRTFDMPDGVIQKEIAAGVAQVVQMLDEEEADGSEI